VRSGKFCTAAVPGRKPRSITPRTSIGSWHSACSACGQTREQQRQPVP
jgi:hypothetical protein